MQTKTSRFFAKTKNTIWKCINSLGELETSIRNRPVYLIVSGCTFQWRESTYHCYDIKHRTFERLKLVQPTQSAIVPMLHYIFMKCIRAKINGSVVIASMSSGISANVKFKFSVISICILYIAFFALWKYKDPNWESFFLKLFSK